MSNAAPPAWVLALPLGSGQWRFLVRAWGYGPFNNAKPDAPPLTVAARAKACNATIAARSGQPKSTAAKQALALAAAGWVRRDGDGYLTLASWRAPGVFTLDAAVEAGLVVRGEAGALSWPHPASGATHTTDGVSHTTDGSTRSRVGPTPPAVHPQPTIGPTHPTDGSQSCLSSLSSPVHEVEARDLHGLDAITADEKHAAYATPADPSASRAQAQLDRERAENRERFMTGERPTGSKLPADVFKAIERHDSCAWALVVSSQTWADACADAMDDLGLDLGHVLRLLDAWTAEARPTVQPGQPSKREIWFTWGTRGKAARAWLLRKLEATRARLRVVGGPDAYELERAEMER